MQEFRQFMLTAKHSEPHQLLSELLKNENNHPPLFSQLLNKGMILVNKMSSLTIFNYQDSRTLIKALQDNQLCFAIKLLKDKVCLYHNNIFDADNFFNVFNKIFYLLREEKTYPLNNSFFYKSKQRLGISVKKHDVCYQLTEVAFALLHEHCRIHDKRFEQINDNVELLMRAKNEAIFKDYFLIRLKIDNLITEYSQLISMRESDMKKIRS